MYDGQCILFTFTLLNRESEKEKSMAERWRLIRQSTTNPIFKSIRDRLDMATPMVPDVLVRKPCTIFLTGTKKERDGHYRLINSLIPHKVSDW